MQRKRLVLVLLTFASVAAFALIGFGKNIFYPVNSYDSVLGHNYSDKCLNASASRRPVWECYEVLLGEEKPDRAMFHITHDSGETHRVVSFNKDGKSWLRFTPTKQGGWCFSQTERTKDKNTQQCIGVNAPKAEYARGFVATAGAKWIRTSTGEAFIPQYAMYDKPDLEAGIEEFINDHGFTGFHITNLRDFLKNPEYFEAVILKTYRAGGVTHFWIWGDAARKQTPTTYGVDVKWLYDEIIARLSPIPGWTFSYGFDLHEWVVPGEVSKLRENMRQKTSYIHLIGARGYKNQYRAIEAGLDYASWEWHRPDYADYLLHIKNAQGRPSFSEDRFRIRPSLKHSFKDYDFEMTRRGLWRSLFAGGVANIWGYREANGEYSSPYPKKKQLLRYRQFVDEYFSRDTIVVQPLVDGGVCIDVNKNKVQYACYIEGVSDVTFVKKNLRQCRVLAIDVKSADDEVEVILSKEAKASLAKESDWVFLIM